MIYDHLKTFNLNRKTQNIKDHTTLKSLYLRHTEYVHLSDAKDRDLKIDCFKEGYWQYNNVTTVLDL